MRLQRFIKEDNYQKELENTLKSVTDLDTNNPYTLFSFETDDDIHVVVKGTYNELAAKGIAKSIGTKFKKRNSFISYKGNVTTIKLT